MNLLNNKYTAKVTQIKRKMYFICIQFTITEGEFTGRKASINIGTAFSKENEEKNKMAYKVADCEAIFKELLTVGYPLVCNNIPYLYDVLLREANSLLNKEFKITIEDETIIKVENT